MIRIGHLYVDAVTHDDVVERVRDGWQTGRGGIIVTPNVDIYLRTIHDDQSRAYLQDCDLIVTDGTPLAWASKLAGDPVPGRVTGAGLTESLAALAAREGRSLFVIGGGPPDTAERAAAALGERHPGLRIAGTIVPKFGFEHDAVVLAEITGKVVASDADLVFVGLGFPKQEGLGLALRDRMPGTWFLGCGAGVQMAAGMVRRAPDWVQAVGAEWMWRMAQEPKRLSRRYLHDDLPVALTLLGSSAAIGMRKRRAARRG